MRLSGRYGLLVIGVCLVVAAVVGVASAAPEVLPSEAKVRTNKGKSVGATTFEGLNGLRITCQKAPGEGTEEAGGKPLGAFHIHFEECEGTVIGIKSVCTGLGDATGSILVLGTGHLWYDSLSPLGVAGVALLEPVHFTCAGGLALVVVRGSLVCLASEPTVKKLTHTGHCEQSKGDPKETKYWNEAGTEETAKLEQSTNGGAFESAAEEGTGEVTGTVETFADKV